MHHKLEQNLIAPEYYNMDIDRWAEDPRKMAILWENEEGDTKQITYVQLRKESNKFANALKNLGLCKGDKLIITLPRIPEAYYFYLGALNSGKIRRVELRQLEKQRKDAL